MSYRQIHTVNKILRLIMPNIFYDLIKTHIKFLFMCVDIHLERIFKHMVTTEGANYEKSSTDTKRQVYMDAFRISSKTY